MPALPDSGNLAENVCRLRHHVVCHDDKLAVKWVAGLVGKGVVKPHGRLD
jgi:hypothetical protein